jgi:predicted Ser/Thr protein kinase
MKDTQTPDSLRPGDLVGPWRVEGYAGRGSYGVVYRARLAGHPNSEPVALKLAVFPSDPRFHREVELLSRNRHSGISRLLDQGWWHASADVAHPYFAMEWIRGRALYEWARMHNPTCREVLQVLAQVAWALEELHKAECLHRDVKGDNILVEPEGRAMLTDFGSGTWKGAPSLTERIIPPNTREYRSPESLRFEWAYWRTQGAHYEARPADDLYALGVAAYRLVTGVYPPPGTDPEQLKAQLEDPLPQRLPVHEFNKRVLPELSALIEKMLAKEPEARGLAREIAEAAESAVEQARPETNVPLLDLEGLEAVPRQVLTEPRMPSWRSRLRPAAIVGGFVLLVVAVVWRPSTPQAGLAMVAQIEEPGAEWAPDAGTRGLGDDLLAARVDSPDVPVGPEPVSRDIPPQPLPGQQRPPCHRRGEVSINGGCWVLQANVEPPCEDGEYEWQGSCYRPAGVRARPPTSKQPQ